MVVVELAAGVVVIVVVVELVVVGTVEVCVVEVNSGVPVDTDHVVESS